MGRKILNSKFTLILVLLALGTLGYFFSIEFQRRYEVEREIQNMNKQIGEMEKNNQELSNLIGYFQSSSFQEKEIRRKLSLQKPGEHVVALPSDKQENSAASDILQENSAPQPNWKKWWNYFFNQGPGSLNY